MIIISVSSSINIHAFMNQVCCIAMQIQVKCILENESKHTTESENIMG